MEYIRNWFGSIFGRGTSASKESKYLLLYEMWTGGTQVVGLYDSKADALDARNVAIDKYGCRTDIGEYVIVHIKKHNTILLGEFNIYDYM